MNEPFTKLLELGVAGLMLYWFAIRMERILTEQNASRDRQTKAFDRLAEANLLAIVGLKNMDQSIKDIAQIRLDEWKREKEQRPS